GSRDFTLLRLQWTNPDVSEPHRVTVILQEHRTFRYNVLICSGGCRSAFYRNMVLNQNSIVNYCKRAGSHLAALPLFRWMENDVISLPFAGLAGRIYKRRKVPVKRTGLAV